MSIPFIKRYCVLFWQENRCKVEVQATSPEHAKAFVEGALERGLNLNATPYDGDYEVVSAEELT